MDAEKQGSSETSSEEIDQQEEAQEESSGGAKRSYECTFCRRGFTNAQALGGHMNIHRKDRAKAKQITPNSSLPRKFSNEETFSSPYVSEFPSQPSRYYSILEAQRNYNMYFQPPPPPPNPRQPPSYAFGYEFLNQRAQSLNMNQELLDANLSLRIGPNHVDANEIRSGIIPKDDEVDLELRLGHDPY